MLFIDNTEFTSDSIPYHENPTFIWICETIYIILMLDILVHIYFSPCPYEVTAVKYSLIISIVSNLILFLIFYYVAYLQNLKLTKNALSTQESMECSASPVWTLSKNRTKPGLKVIKNSCSVELSIKF